VTPLHAARLARDLRSKARAAFTAGRYDSAATLYRMDATTQALALLPGETRIPPSPTAAQPADPRSTSPSTRCTP
jgi:hypothetical protein